MSIDIPDDLHRRLEQLAKGTGQDIGALVCEALEQRLALEERKQRPQASSAWQPGGVSNVDIDGNNTLHIKTIGVTIATFETLPNGISPLKGA